MTERTLVIVKPDGVQRGKTGDIIRRIERKGYCLVALEMVQATETILREHYAELVEKSFFPEIVSYMTESPVVAIIIEGENVVEGWRSLMGTTMPTQAAPGTVRGDFGRDWPGNAVKNVVHGSDSPASAEREIAIWFPNLA
ncbi:nucleoside-diphosphate kinase [Periweissella cryptocerci]|uniref:Nucleoside diphosphate kinase n=1 Tax=Periweissella cryptocerci TaxID=2506420 RepID=A0A4P6YRC0_9LACO|nr:nucleoside-diphosphate kinase [Periweissella cryptocerci]QBO35143.1 nucleoside-diphosphate kinase [Periweissella cryptocerci]